MIPDEAVEAGLAAWADRKAVWPRDVVRHILEAAAPHMMGDAWAHGHQAGWNDRDDDAQAGWVPSGYTTDTPNPYRKPTDA